MQFGICIPIRRNVEPHVNIEMAKKAFDKSEEPNHGTEARRSLFSLCGTIEETVNYLQRFKEAGVSHMVVDPTAKDDEEMFETMERFSEVMRILRD